MLRKSSTTDRNAVKITLPFSTDPDTSVTFTRTRIPGFSNTLEAALATLPIYGGAPTDTESPSTTETTAGGSATDSAGQSGNDTSQAGGGDSGKTEEAKAPTPEEVAKILKQNEELSAKNKTLLAENNSHKVKQQETERAKLSREEAQDQQIQELTDTVQKMDAALRNQAIVNAINSYKDIDWHDPHFAISKLDPAILEDMVVDLEAGTVTINGIENDLKRIAKENAWAVKSKADPANNGNGTQQNGITKTQQRGSGAPPASPGGGGQKQARREALIDKFPVIGMGRR